METNARLKALEEDLQELQAEVAVLRTTRASTRFPATAIGERLATTTDRRTVLRRIAHALAAGVGLAAASAAVRPELAEAGHGAINPSSSGSAPAVHATNTSDIGVAIQAESGNDAAIWGISDGFVATIRASQSGPGYALNAVADGGGFAAVLQSDPGVPQLILLAVTTTVPGDSGPAGALLTTVDTVAGEFVDLWFSHQLNAGAGEQVFGKVLTTVNFPGGGVIPINPVRVLDTRDGSGGVPTSPTAQGPFGNAAEVTLTLGGFAGIPSNTRAVIGNLTAVGPTANGYLTVYPTGGTIPATSTLNFVGGGPPTPNAFIVGLGTPQKKLSIFVASGMGAVHFIVDLTGYIV